MTYFITRHDVEIAERAFPLYSYFKSNGGYYTQMFLPQNINYLVEHFGTKIAMLEEEIAAHEKNKDVAYAYQARKQLKAYEALIEKFNMLISE
jgi:hypothetical protein